MLASENTSAFGVLLRQHRLAAGLTQEGLAERSGLGTRSIQHLERGETRPQRVTARRLAVALALEGEQRSSFEALAQPSPRRRTKGAGVAMTVVAGQGSWDSGQPAETMTALSHDAHRGHAVLRDRARSAHNLPIQVTSFIGRERELAEVLRLLSTTRLLTLTGTGGTGKTRLALQVAAELLEHYPQGVWLAELAPLADPTVVPLAVATAVGIREEPGQPVLATLVAALPSRHLLLVLDNCEHLLDACAALVEALIRACPWVTILATSREALGIAGETAWRVPSLALPDVRQVLPLEVLAQVEAVRLFIERGRAVQPHFALTAHNAPIVAQVCRQLDGIPLAIELAAARLRGLAIEELVARLDQRFRLLTGGSRTALPRQQTLQATVGWSYGLLSVPEQTLFNRLAVFAGSFTLDAAEAVCPGGPIATEEVLDLVLRLVDRSLVTAEERAGNVERYRLLETLRQYGRERLLAGGEAEGLYARHAAHYRALAEEAEPALFGPQKAAWLDRLDAEHMNIRQALRWALDVRAAQEGLRLAGALMWYWHGRGYLGEGYQWLVELLALPEAAARTTARAKALSCMALMRKSARLLVGAQAVGADTHALAAEAVAIARETGGKWVLAGALWLLGGWIARADYPAGRAMLEECVALWRAQGVHAGVHGMFNVLGDIAWEQGDTAAAGTWWSESLRLARQTGDQEGSARELGDLGMMAYHEGDYATARSQIEESLALYRALHNRVGISVALGSLGAVARAQRDTTLAGACYEEKLALWREVGDRTGIAATLAELGALAQQEGAYAQAQSLLQEALTLRRELGNAVDVAASLAHLGDLAYAQGDTGRAASLYTEGLDLLRLAGDRAVAAACLEGLAMVAVAGGQLERAARLYGAGATLRRGTFVLNVWDDRVARDRQVTALRLALGDEAFVAAWAEGQAMTLEQAIAEAMESGEAS